jgi:hypothetical protein
MQLVVARVVAAAAVASEASARTCLKAARQSAEDHTTTAKTAATTTVTERDSLASRLALAEAEVETLCRGQPYGSPDNWGKPISS